MSILQGPKSQYMTMTDPPGRPRTADNLLVKLLRWMTWVRKAVSMVCVWMESVIFGLPDGKRGG